MTLVPLLLSPNSRAGRRIAAGFGAVAALYLLGALALFVRRSLHWPLVGDSALLHYCVFLLRHGYAPYRGFVDPNLPGAYAAESLVIALFGYGALAWRLFDLFLLLLLGASALLLLWTPRHPWRAALAALWVAAIFALEHGRDGLMDLGQRDLLMTVLLALAVAAFCAALRVHGARAPRIALLLCGTLLGAAATVKPVAILLLPALLAIGFRARTARAGRDRARTADWPSAGALSAGAAIAPVATCVYLLREHALGAFLQVEARLVPLHASLFRRPWLHLLAHLVASTVLLPVLFSLPAIGRSRPWRTPHGQALLAGFAVGAVSFLVQGRGYPYHRYPAFFFLLLLCARAFLLLLPSRRVHWLFRAGGAAALLLTLAVTVPRSLRHVESIEPEALPFRQALTTALTAHGGPALSGHVQCLDMAGGCVTALLDQRLLPATGFLYDCYALARVAPRFAAEQTRYRDAWLAALHRNPPALFIVTSDECGPRDLRYAKLSRWPALAQLLQQHYVLSGDWQPRRRENWNGHARLPYCFRLYTLREASETAPY